ncbi:hypothetical protein BDD12DRAFT_945473 [Trichophaea hybrida]|nr:hypothetical protein BDD12DRAFT_945473 [Trichophaea hybrida]
MADTTFIRTQILDNCAILFPPPVSPTLLTVDGVRHDNSTDLQRMILVVCAKTSQLLLRQNGTGLEDFRSLLASTEKMLTSHATAILRGEGPASRNPERTQPVTALDETSTCLKNLGSECAALRKEKKELQKRLESALAANDELRKRLEHSIGSREEALSMVQTSNANHADALQMAQRQMERLWATQNRRGGSSEIGTDDTGTSLATPTSSVFSLGALRERNRGSHVV